MKTGTDVIKLEDGRYAVDLLDGNYSIFSKKRHAEEFIIQQNTVFVWKRKEEKNG